MDCFNHEGVSAVLHCGDFVAPFAILPFEQLSCKQFYAVFGNNDGEKEGLKSVAAEREWEIEEQPKLMEFSDCKIAMGHEPYNIDRLLGDADCDVILHGHTHRKRADRQNGRLIINPGEGGGWTTGRATVAVLDVESLEVKFHNL